MRSAPANRNYVFIPFSSVEFLHFVDSTQPFLRRRHLTCKRGSQCTHKKTVIFWLKPARICSSTTKLWKDDKTEFLF